MKTLTLSLRKLSQKALDLEKKEYRVIGATFAYKWDDLIASATKRHETIDSLMTEEIAKGFAARPKTSPALVWYSCNNLSGGTAFLQITSKVARSSYSWFTNIPGCYDHSQRDFLVDNACPFAYWDGRVVYRVYDLRGAKPGKYLICDLGMPSGLFVENVDRETYYRTVEIARINPDHSAAPLSRQQPRGKSRGIGRSVVHAAVRVVA